ncbi:MAG: alanine racemase [Pseudomonadota bacterium]
MNRDLTLHIDLKAIQRNYLILKEHAPNSRIAAAVKADAYGMGMEKVAPALYAAGCREFFVAQIGEAISLKTETLKDKKDIKIYALNGISSQKDIKKFTDHNIQPVLNSIPQIKLWQDAAKAAGTRLPAMIHFDTGINRLGLSNSETEWALQTPTAFEGLDITAIITHPASADRPDSPQTEDQFIQFKKICAQFTDLPRSFCNSAAVFLRPDYHLDLIRSGIALYGGNPVPDRQNVMQSVVSLTAPVLQIRQVKAGDSIGYGASYTCQTDSTLATLAIGYADGLPRSLSNCGHVYFQGQPCPIRGRISMDLTVIDISALSNPPKPGDHIEILGENQSVDDLAMDAGTISYEVLTMLGKQVQKCYSRQ